MFKLAFLVLALALSQSNAAHAKQEVEPRLSGGVNVAQGSYPFFVGVFAQNFFLCGGVILNANHVLTAGTCLMYGDNILYFSNQISVTFGSNVINTVTERLNVFALYVHPQLNTFTVVNDVGVIRTATNFDFPFAVAPLVAPAVLNEWIVPDNFICQVVAWNLVQNIQTQQMLTNHPIVNRDICNNLAANLGRISDSMICAGLTGAGAGVCGNNLGGALVCDGRVHGILSSGFGCGVAGNPGVYSQIRFHLEWIQAQFTRQDVPPGNMSPLERLPALS